MNTQPIFDIARSTAATAARREFLHRSAAAVALAALPQFACMGATARAADEPPKKPTEFQIACMTLPYSQHPWPRALSGIKAAGYKFVAWGTTHRQDGVESPVIAADALAGTARELGKRCRDLGLEPVMMFSGIYPEHKDAVAVLTQRIVQAQAAGIGQVLTFGHTEGGHERLWIERFKLLGPIARDHGVTLVIKQHGGSTGTGEACAKIVRQVADENVWVNYDAGNVMDYLNLDPLADIRQCAAEVRSFCVKDHRNEPLDEDCGPGFGEIDHYNLLASVAFAGRKMPLCCENIFPPLLPRPTSAEAIDDYARRARLFLETVTAGLLQAGGKA